MTLADNLAVLQSFLPGLESERNLGPHQNDVYEAIADLCNLSQRAVAGDTRINYSVRAQSDSTLFRKLRDIASAKAERDRERYLPLLDCAEKLLDQIAQISIPPEGHLGVLRIIRKRFGFLFEDYGFASAEEEPTGMRLVRGAVAVELRWSVSSTLSFQMTRGDSGDFWIEDLLFLQKDQRYLSIPHSLQMDTEADVDGWFGFISNVVHQYGDELLRDVPGAFERLARAQAQRDAEYVAMMDAKYGSK